MSAFLSHQFAENFARAEIKEIFFPEKEREHIEALEMRERAPEGEPISSCNTNLFFGFFSMAHEIITKKQTLTSRTQTLRACTIVFLGKACLEYCRRILAGHTIPLITKTFFEFTFPE